MSIRTRFLIVIFLTIGFSAFLTFSAFQTKKKLEIMANETTLLEKRVTALTFFRAALRQSLLEFTQFLYSRRPSDQKEYFEAMERATDSLKTLKTLTKASHEDLTPEDELERLQIEFDGKLKTYFQKKNHPHSAQEISESDQIADFFQKALLTKINAHLFSINNRLESESKLHQSAISDMVLFMPRIAGIFTLFVILLLSFAGVLILKRLKSLTKAMDDFDLGRSFQNSLALDGNDEIAKISVNFAALATRIQQTEQLLFEKQKQVVMTAKLASLGEMSAGIAHEINNPLSIIAGSLGLLTHYKNQPEKFAAKIESIQKSCVRISKIVNGLKKYSRSAEKTDYRVHSPNTILEEVLVLTSSKSLRHSTPVSLEGKVSGNIYCDEIEIEQVFVNLISNAIDAVKQISEKWVKVSIAEEGPSIVIRVMDSGNGISEAVQKKLFDPFFTTKKTGEGTGLGLSISKGILDGHRATIAVIQNSPHTCFEIRFQKAEGITHAA